MARLHPTRTRALMPPKLLVWAWLRLAGAQDALSRISLEGALILGLVAVSLVTHGLNMFHYPSFTRLDDEGIYAQQAWAIIRQGRLAPYTYFYDHAPAGWILLATWLALTGGPETFGGAIDSGRMFMLLLHLASVPLLYRLARRLGCTPAFAAFAGLLYSVSPMAIGYPRLLLLDNIMI
ncbi:MAG: 4-amino-4-deoxy-L-arabinose transferase, partial [Chloroflexota bacterium]